MPRNKVFSKGLVVGIILLFIGAGVYPAIAVKLNTSINAVQDEKSNVNAKDYLFQTIIDIANNPDVKDLIKDNYELFIPDTDFNSVFRQILFKKPIFFFSLLFTRPSITYKYLDACYNRGCEITNILGEDKTLEITASARITNPEIFDKFNNIIMNNEELPSKITTLKEMNKELKQGQPFKDYPIICAKLNSIFNALCIPILYLYKLILKYRDNPILVEFFTKLIYMSIIPLFIVGNIMIWIFNCPQVPDPPYP
jgi:hypothetical protein